VQSSSQFNKKRILIKPFISAETVHCIQVVEKTLQVSFLISEVFSRYQKKTYESGTGFTHRVFRLFFLSRIAG